MPAGLATGFFTSAAAGMLAALLLAPFRELGRFFFVTTAGVAFLGLCLAAPGRFAAASAIAGRVAAGIALALTIAYLAALVLLRRGRSWRGLLAGAAAASLATVAWDGWSTLGGAPRWLSALSALSGSALLGAVIVGMLLGHWYLVRTRLDVSYLSAYARLFGIALAVRAGLVVVGLLGAGAASPQGPAGFLHGLAVDRGFFFWQRLGFGILGPAAFAWMVAETARIRSTQSATGLLYMAVIFVTYGEFLARYMTVAGAGPM